MFFVPLYSTFLKENLGFPLDTSDVASSTFLVRPHKTRLGGVSVVVGDHVCSLEGVILKAYAAVVSFV